MDIRIADHQIDAESASTIHALGWKSGYRGIFSDKLLDGIPLHFWVDYFKREPRRFDAAMGSLNGEDVAVATYGLLQDCSEENAGEIWSFYLLEKAWGKGYAEQLMKFIIEQLQNKGCMTIYLWTLRDNIRARHFYEKCHFKQTGKENLFTFQGETKMQMEFVWTKEGEY